jgi:hypothetical protein
LRLRPQPFAKQLASSAKAVTFEGFKRRVTSFLVAGMALRDIPTCFITCQEVVLCDRRNTFASFSEDDFLFSWQAQHFADLHRHFAWQAQHFRRAVLRVFCESHCQGYVKWRQGANSVADVMKIDGSLVANLEVHKKTCRKSSKCSLMLPCSSCIFALFRFI